MNPSLRKTNEPRTRFITLRHQTSGATKRVEYLGMAGRPLRAQVWWPGAGDYLIAPQSGRLCGTASSSATRKLWQVVDEDRVFLREQWRIEIARARQMTHSDQADL